MKLQNLVLAVAGASMLSMPVAAAVSKEKADWARGPVQWLMTADDQAAWKAVTNDQEAQNFIDLFWARRDPTPGTERNENREAFDARVAYADKNFAAGRTKGSMTDRGMMLIVVGSPARAEQSGGRSGKQVGAPMTEGVGDTRGAGQNAAKSIWIYEKQSVPAFAPGADFRVTFVDRNGTKDFKVEPTAERLTVNELVEMGRAAWIARPKLTLAELRTPAKVQTVTVPGPVIATPAAPATAFKSEALAAAVASFKSAASSPFKGVHANYGQFVTASGEYYVPVQLYFSSASGVKGDTPVTFFGQVEDATGKVIAVYEEPATLTTSKSDAFYDRSLTLPSGNYTGYFGAVDQSGKVLGVAKTSMSLSSIDKSSAGVSNLILTTNLYALPKAQLPTDPFAFGGLKVVPKGDRVFSRATDELDYFVEVRNPGIDATTGKPNFTAKITITPEKGNKMAGPPSPVVLEAVKGVEGHYWLGSGYPLTAFPPGKYTFDMQLTDKVTNTKYDLKETFTVVEK